MHRKLCVIGLAFLMSFSVMTFTADAEETIGPGEQILGPWLWVIAHTEGGQGGLNSTDIDSLAVATDNAVTEDMVAKNSAEEGDSVGDYKWTLAALPEGGDINAVVNETGMAEGALDDVTSYALITLVSETAQSEVTMGASSDDSVKVWLNGEVVHTHAANRGHGNFAAESFQDQFTVNLNAGDNLLLVKISERGGGWGMHIGMVSDTTVRAVFRPPIEHITGEYLWIIAPTEPNQGGANSTDIDSLAAASDGVVTEDMIAKDGAREGDTVGAYDWVLAALPEGGDINVVVNETGMAEGALDDVTSYALITLVAEEAMEDVIMGVSSDDSVKVWLNGEVVHTHAANRGHGNASSFQDKFSVNLKEGDNRLLVKISERGGGWGMFVGIGANVEAVHKPGAAVGTAVEAAGKLVITWGKLKAAR